MSLFNNAIIGSSSQGGYQISRSVRLRNSASAYFNRTPAVTGNRQIMTFSFWMKRGLLTYSPNYLEIFTAYPGTSAIDQIAFSPSSDSLRVWFNGSSSADLITTQVFRDPSAWYHIVVGIDTTQATAANRIKVYVNGSQVTAFSTATYPVQNYSSYWNSTSYAAAIGANLNGPQGYFDGYLAEVNFIDGQALTPSSFGETDTVTGVWKPKKYMGTYGTNGYYLNFRDNSAATATTIGKDYSGNGNNWTPNNISVTAGVTYDSMLDVPTSWPDGGNGRGNYATLNPNHSYPTGSRLTITQGNLYASGASVADRYALGTMTIPPTGKIYFEATVGTLTSGACYVGLASSANPAASQGSVYFNTGQVFVNGSQATAGAATYTSGNVIGVAVDYAAGTVAFYKNNTLSYTSTGVTNPEIPIVYAGGVCDWYVNFGQRPFTYTPPTGFKALNTQNLPDATIRNGGKHMNVIPFTATGVDQVITGAGFAPDFVWIKNRASWAGPRHTLYDTLRGAVNRLDSSTTEAEAADNDLISFNADGFQGNLSGTTYVSWLWNAGGSTVTNTSGSISAQVRANPTSGFSIVTYTGTGANATVGHGLGITPKMIILKPRSIVSSWLVWHTAFAGTEYIVLESTAAKASLAAMWNSTTPTSSVFSIGTNANVNQSAATFVAYCFSEVSGFSKFGTYTGNASATDGPFVYTGFRPRFVMCKRIDAVGNWPVMDSSRSGYNQANNDLYANLSQTEATSAFIDILSNGFKVHATSTEINGNGGTYIYMAFAENPFKNSLAR